MFSRSAGVADIKLTGSCVAADDPDHDASYGLVLKGKGNGRFEAMPCTTSGLSVIGEVKALRVLKAGEKTYCLVIRNNDVPAVFEIVSAANLRETIR